MANVGRLKVLFLPSWFPSPERPIDGIFIEDQAKVIATRHDVTVLVPGVSSVHGLWNPRRRARDTNETRDGYAVARYFAQSWVPRSYRASLGTLRRAAFRGFEDLMKNWGRPDVIHAHVVLPCGWIGAEISRRYDIPLVLTEHSSPFSMHLRKPWMRSRVQYTLNCCHAVVALSPNLAADIEDFSPGTKPDIIGEVVPDPGPIGESLCERGHSGSIKMAFVGGLREQKGVAYLLRAVSLIVGGGIEVDLELAGEGPLRGELEGLCRDLGISEHCHFLGALPRDAVFDLFRRCDLAVVPSLHETYCVAAAEALACGTPVVATRCGGPEIFITPESGRVVDPGDVESLTAGIRDVISRIGTFDGAAIRKSIFDTHGSSAFVERIQGIYTSLQPSTQKARVA